MRRILVSMMIVVPALFVGGNGANAQGTEARLRGVFVKPERATAEFLAVWKAKGANLVVVPLDEATKPRWEAIARTVEGAGMTLRPWVEVARNPTMADAHPEWMATPGGHHDDWRGRFLKPPIAKSGEVIKTWPWVPIGYAPAFEAHRERLKTLLSDLPGKWSGIFLNDLQAGPSSCGCGNDQCRWALDYGAPSTASKTPGDDAAARIVAELIARHPGKEIVPVWVTECEMIDLSDAKNGTGLCNGVPCAKTSCWPKYALNWNPLLKSTDGPIAVALWPETFRRRSPGWIESAPALFHSPPRGGTPISPKRTVAVVEAWDKPDAAVDRLRETVERSGSGWVLALDPIDQSWEPRVVSTRKP